MFTDRMIEYGLAEKLLCGNSKAGLHPHGDKQTILYIINFKLFLCTVYDIYLLSYGLH